MIHHPAVLRTVPDRRQSALLATIIGHQVYPHEPGGPYRDLDDDARHRESGGLLGYQLLSIFHMKADRAVPTEVLDINGVVVCEVIPVSQFV